MDKKCDMCNSSYYEVKKKELEHIDQYGFFTRFLIEGKPNCNTHGLEKMDHLNFQICLNIPPKTQHGLFWDLVNKVKDGKKFKDGDILDDLIIGYKVKLMLTKEGGRDVLRLLFPDKSHRFPDEEDCEEEYKKQMEVEDEH